jgi:hypothetical protein
VEPRFRHPEREEDVVIGGYPLITAPAFLDARQIRELCDVLIDPQQYIPARNDGAVYLFRPQVIFEFATERDTLVAYALLASRPARWAFAPSLEWINETGRVYGKRGVVEHRSKSIVLGVAMELFPGDSLLTVLAHQVGRQR